MSLLLQRRFVQKFRQNHRPKMKKTTSGCLTSLILPTSRPYSWWKLTLAKKLIAIEKITPSCQTNLSSKHFIKRYNNKNELWKTVRLTSFHNPFYLLYFCPSLRCFVSAVLFLPSFTVLSIFKNVLLNLVAVPTVWMSMMNFVTQLL